VEVQIKDAASALRAGGVIAYPTEYCFGLGCDPRNSHALERLLEIKQRKKDQGVILIAANIEQVSEYASLDGLSRIDEIIGSWPGPNTWLLPAKDSVSSWVKGIHTSIAIRVSGHVICHSLCLEFGHPIVSTSANRHGHDALLNSDDVAREFSHELDFVLDAPVGASNSASTIRDAITGEKLR